MHGFGDVPGVDLRRWPTPQPIDIGGQITVRLRSDHEHMIRAALWEQVEAGVTDQPMLMCRTAGGRRSAQTVMVITFELEPGCGRLAHRVGIWPPGSARTTTSWSNCPPSVRYLTGYKAAAMTHTLAEHRKRDTEARAVVEVAVPRAVAARGRRPDPGEGVGHSMRCCSHNAAWGAQGGSGGRMGGLPPAGIAEAGDGNPMSRTVPLSDLSGRAAREFNDGRRRCECGVRLSKYNPDRRCSQCALKRGRRGLIGKGRVDFPGRVHSQLGRDRTTKQATTTEGGVKDV